MNPSTYYSHENGQSKFGVEQAEQYARCFGVQASWLLLGVDATGTDQIAPGATLTTKESSPAQIDSPAPNGTISPVGGVTFRRIPVYGHAVGGENGEFILNGNKIADVLAPAPIADAVGAYGVLVAGESMEPRYHAGEVVYVHPNLPVRRGDYVVAQIPSRDGDPPLAYVKRFVKVSGGRLFLEQLNPPKAIDFPFEGAKVHKIVLGGTML